MNIKITVECFDDGEGEPFSRCMEVVNDSDNFSEDVGEALCRCFPLFESAPIRDWVFSAAMQEVLSSEYGRDAIIMRHVLREWNASGDDGTTNFITAIADELAKATKKPDSPNA